MKNAQPEGTSGGGAKKPTLLILAAGMGSRYGGLKQIDAMGPDGEWLLEYALYDAARSGFGKVVFVVRRSFREAFGREMETRFQAGIPYELVCQENDVLPDGCTIPEGREKPLGTGHAIWCAHGVVEEPFAVINADDFYGREAIGRMAEALCALSAGVDPHHFCMVAYPLEKTLSEHGRVSRGICRISADGLLEGVEEHTHLYPGERGVISESGDGVRTAVDARERVSMNLWGFTTDIFPRLEEALGEFSSEAVKEPKVELFIPTVVDTLIQQGLARVDV
ncbi:MAG TPA: nucleotidyltransferase, partial [Oceanipulchritudo sp.]|nr:nucleotidyltransferase [Oceanipulchritudo sp.]